MSFHTRSHRRSVRFSGGGSFKKKEHYPKVNCPQCGKEIFLVYPNDPFCSTKCRKEYEKMHTQDSRNERIPIDVHAHEPTTTRFLGESLEIVLLDVIKNQEFRCPINCKDYDQPRKCGFGLKRDLMVEPVSEKLVCTIALVLAKNISNRQVSILSEKNQLIDSLGNVYADFGYACDPITKILETTYRDYQLFGGDISKDAKVKFLFLYPQLSLETKPMKFIVEAYVYKGWTRRLVGTLEFEVKRETVPRKRETPSGVLEEVEPERVKYRPERTKSFDEVKKSLTESSASKVHSRLCEILAEKVLRYCYPAFKSGRHVYLIIDTQAGDGAFFERQILDIANHHLGTPYPIDFAKIGGGTTFAQRLLSLIFLNSDFTLDLLKKARHGKQIKILRTWAEGKSISLSRISQKFLECRKCSDSEREKLGLDYDLTSEENAIRFFHKCVKLYTNLFRRDAVFFFKSLRPNKRMMGLPSTIRFLEKIESELPVTLVMMIPKQIEHYLLPIWDKFSYFHLQKVDSEDVEKIVQKICRTPNVQGEINFSSDGLQQFCREMCYLFGKKISALHIIRAISDAIGHKRLHHLDIIKAQAVRELFSTIKVKIGLPAPRLPTKCKSPYFGNEIERLTKECQRRELDPHYALPYPFRNVQWHILKGYIIYSRGDDKFACRIYMSRAHFRRLSRSLYTLGYRYVRGTRSWAFSPRT